MKEKITDWIKSFYLHTNNGVEVFDQTSYDNHSVWWLLALMAAFSVLSYFMWWFFRNVMVQALGIMVDRTRVTWDDYLVEHKVFRSLAHLFPLMFMEYFLSIIFYNYPKWEGLFSKFVWIWIIIAIIYTVNRSLGVLKDIIQENERFKDKPIQSYIQVVKIIITLLLLIVMLSIVTDQSLGWFFGAFGTMTAIIVLVFRDTILGFVGSIQIATNDMIRIGDWITMDKFGADGDVEEISLTTIKIQNFDKTITTIPTYSFISDSFKNWRGMEESAGRRIKRAVNIQIDSVKFVSPGLLTRLKEIALLSEFVSNREQEIKEYNEKHGFVGEKAINGRRQTNLGVFRRYIEHYLRNHPLVNQEMALMVRQMSSNENGMPLEVYCFTKEKEWEIYESIQADIFDHIFSVVHLFELSIFERPSGKDLRKLEA
ncbi:MAG: mechanosensitive ion channel [Crocinitomicaceae bacterium]|jgi:miniconductance mechanosensitive channel|nr:mechanosensitive ion channel [Crocinitomicaceae bacterium]